MLPAPLAALGAYKQFCLYLKSSKAPCDYRNGRPCDVQDPANQTDLTTAYAAAQANAAYGIGFVLTAADPFVVFDADKALMPDGTWSPESLQLLASLPGAAVEISTSGRGFHIWASATSVPVHGCKNIHSRFEMYHTGRYIALGGHAGTIGDAKRDVTPLLPAIVAHWFTPSAAAPASDWTDEPRADWRGPTDDDELIRRMLAARTSAASAFGSRATPAELWNAVPEALARAYPPTGEGDWDGSSADAALCAHLAFWTGCDCVRIERLMRRSALRRDKYDREDYLPRTILRAVSQCESVYREREVDLPVPAASATPTIATSRLVTGDSFCWPDVQTQQWAGFAYIAEDNKILTDNGEMLNEPRFKAKYGGLCYVMDAGNEKRTDNAWEAFVYSKAVRHTKVDRATFRPDLPARTVLTQDGLTYVNTHRRIDVARVRGDVSPFLTHITKLFPDQRDRDVALYYLAALVQFQGIKFNWALFIQGTHGNGKSLLSLCVKAAIGDVYCHMPRALGLIEDKNDWMARTTFCGVEDMHLPARQGDLIEILKPMITLDYQPIRSMGVSQTMKRVCVNFLLNSNHKDGAPKSSDDRRISPLFCAQQRREHLERDGLTSLYFSELYDWLEQRDGYAIMSEYLHTLQIPAEFGLPYLKGNAPDTTSTREAVSLSVGPVDAEVLEAIASHRSGFCGGWVSSIAVDELLKEKRMDGMCPRSKRQELMERIGYVHHPALHGGRASTPLIGGQRPVLYIKAGHLNGQITSPVDITRTFERMQSESMMVAAFDRKVV